VKVFTRNSPLMPCAAPITAICTGFSSFDIGGASFALL
jgi:hypothetical protein